MNGQARRSIAFSFLDRYGSIVLGFVSTIILSRLLTPEDFGVFSVAMAVVMMIDIFRDFGTGSYLVQCKDLTLQHLQAAFTTVLGISLLCALLLMLGTQALATFYNEPRLWQLMPLFALNLLLGPFSLPGMSLLRRDFAFDTIAAINITASVGGLAVVVTLALLGQGVMSLAWATLASSAIRLIAFCAVRPNFAVFRITLQGWREPAHFGVISTATILINVLHEQLPQLIIGKVLSFSAVGIFARATSVCQLPDRFVTSAIGSVVLPLLSEQARNGRALKPAYLLSLSYMSALQWSILLWLALLAEPVVTLLYGHQWLEVAPLVRIMSIAALTMFPAFMTYPTLVATGSVRDTLTMSLITLPPSILLIALAAPYGLQAVASTQLVNAPLQVLVALYFIRRRIGVTLGDIARAVRPSVVVALCSATVPAVMVAVQSSLGATLSFPLLMIASAGTAAGWLVGITLSEHPLLGELRNGARMIGERFARRPS